ncbi:D-galactoside-specific lectin-like, partial [Sinocyclocheilus grahami]|uniref:D-galactoside-specific lectin-like n=1 Tax=Sinocyclocheilus grahami TaxID=75366 RepID=UPI0007AD3C7F
MGHLRMFFPDVSYSLLLLGISCLTGFTKTSQEFSGYLSRVLRNYTEQACDGEFLTVRCPPRTSITVQSAFYGRTDPAHSPQCLSPYSSAGPLSVHDITSCHVSTSLQVMTSRCQGKRSCVVRASTQEFGDPCYHGTHKYLSIIHTC